VVWRCSCAGRSFAAAARCLRAARRPFIGCLRAAGCACGGRGVTLQRGGTQLEAAHAKHAPDTLTHTHTHINTGADFGRDGGKGARVHEPRRPQVAAIQGYRWGPALTNARGGLFRSCRRVVVCFPGAELLALGPPGNWRAVMAVCCPLDWRDA
jgi:hypothetical protein